MHIEDVLQPLAIFLSLKPLLGISFSIYGFRFVWVDDGTFSQGQLRTLHILE